MQDRSTALLTALRAVIDAPDVQSARVYVVQALGLWGIEAAYFLAPLSNDPRVGRLFSTIGVPRLWERHYRARLHQFDPLPRLAMQRSMAFAWPDDIDEDELTEQEKRYLALAAKYGMGSGIATVAYGPKGRMGFLGAVWSQPAPPSDEVLLAVQQIGQVSFLRYCEILREDIDVPPMSNRELEVLEWMCRGKSNPVIAEILGVSRSSVDTYIRRIFTKLDVTDRTAACMRAYSLGLIIADDIAPDADSANRLIPRPSQG